MIENKALLLSFIKCPCKVSCRIAALGDAGGSHNNTVLPFRNLSFSPFYLPEAKLQVPPTCHTSHAA